MISYVVRTITYRVDEEGRAATRPIPNTIHCVDLADAKGVARKLVRDSQNASRFDSDKTIHRVTEVCVQFRAGNKSYIIPKNQFRHFVQDCNAAMAEMEGLDKPAPAVEVEIEA